MGDRLMSIFGMAFIYEIVNFAAKHRNTKFFSSNSSFNIIYILKNDFVSGLRFSSLICFSEICFLSFLAGLNVFVRGAL